MDRFWSKVEPSGDCLVWTGSKSSDGYGRIKYEGRSQGTHRVALKILGIDLGDLQALHACDNPPCVNPEHLFLGSKHDNWDDMRSKGRNKGASGERNAKSKLTEAQVVEIRQKYSDRKTSTSAIAKLYGVSQPMISYILIGKNWRSA